MSQREHNSGPMESTQSDMPGGDLHSTRTCVYEKNISLFVLLAVLALPTIGAAVASAQMMPGWQSTLLGAVPDGFSALSDLSPLSIDGLYGTLLTLTVLFSTVWRGVRNDNK